MYEIATTDEFDEWLDDIKDRKARNAVFNHLDRIKIGNFGVTRQVYRDVYEKKINVSGGYRLYYFVRFKEVVVMLTGGTKRTQERDIKKAMEIRKELYGGKT